MLWRKGFTHIGSMELRKRILQLSMTGCLSVPGKPMILIFQEHAAFALFECHFQEELQEWLQPRSGVLRGINANENGEEIKRLPAKKAARKQWYKSYNSIATQNMRRYRERVKKRAGESIEQEANETDEHKRACNW